MNINRKIRHVSTLPKLQEFSFTFPRKSQKIEMENDKFIKVKRLNLEEAAPKKIEGEATAGEKKEGNLGRAAKVVAMARNSRSCDR